MEGRRLLSTINVDTFADVIDPSDGRTSLREAIATAAAGDGEDLVIVPRGILGGEGTYALTLGELAIDDVGPLTIQSDGGTATIDAQGDSRVFSVSARSVVTLAGLTITGGHSTGQGGALLNDGTLTVEGSTFQDNSADIDGGAIRISPGSSTIMASSHVLNNAAGDSGGGISLGGHLEFLSGSIAGNTAVSGRGGGIDISGGLVMESTLIDGNLAALDGGGIANRGSILQFGGAVSNNTAGGSGGGLYNSGTIECGTDIAGNSAARFGGGVYTVGGASFGGDFRTNSASLGGGGIAVAGGNCTIGFAGFTANSSEGYGGAIFHEAGDLNVSDSRLDQNTSDIGGGGLYSSGLLFQMERTTFAGNTAPDGGGAFIDSDGTPLIRNATFEGNTATSGDGGGLYNRGATMVMHSTFEKNSCRRSGPVIFSSNSLHVSDCIIKDNGLGKAADVIVASGSTSVGGCLFEGNGGGVWLSEGLNAVVGNRFTHNRGGAIDISGFNATASSNWVEDNEGGISVSGDQAVVMGNSIIRSGSGLGVGGHGAVVQGNEIRDNDSSGLSVGDAMIVAGNTVTGNLGHGITISGSFQPVLNNRVTGNHGDGIVIFDGSGNIIGEPGAGNTITGNGGSGIAILSGSGNSIRANIINSNGGLPIDLGGDGPTPNDLYDNDDGPNGFQNYPVITGVATGAATRVIGTLHSTPGLPFTIDLYTSTGAAPGDTSRYLGSFEVLTDESGDASFDETLPVATAPGAIVVATASNLYDLSTSELSLVSLVRVTPTSGLVTTEAGGQATFSIVLAVRPTADVIVPLSSSDATEGTVSASSLTFTPADWDVPQVVTVTGADDSIFDGPIAYSIATAPMVSADPLFSGLDADDVEVTNLDDDLPPMTPVSPLGGLIYATGSEGVVEAPGDFATFAVSVDPGQKITVVVEPLDSGLRPTIELTRAGTAAAIGVATAPANGADAVLLSVATHGQLGEAGAGAMTYRVRVGGALGTTGRYAVRVILNAAVELESYGRPNNNSFAAAQNITTSFITLHRGANRAALVGIAGDTDIYSFRLSAGQAFSASLTFDALSAGPSGGSHPGTLELIAPDRSTVLASAATIANLQIGFSNIIAPATGTYYLRTISPLADRPYRLLTLRDAIFDLGDNDTLAKAQPMGPVHYSLGHVGAPGDAADVYSFEAIAGQGIALYTITPGDGPGEFVNTLDPRMELFDSSGRPIAGKVTSADGRNERLVFRVPATGTYYVAISAEGRTSGEYVFDPIPPDDAEAASLDVSPLIAEAEGPPAELATSAMIASPAHNPIASPSSSMPPLISPAFGPEPAPKVDRPASGHEAPARLPRRGPRQANPGAIPTGPVQAPIDSRAGHPDILQAGLSLLVASPAIEPESTVGASAESAALPGSTSAGTGDEPTARLAAWDACLSEPLETILPDGARLASLALGLGLIALQAAPRTDLPQRACRVRNLSQPRRPMKAG